MIKLYTTEGDLEKIAEAIDSARKNSVSVTVPRQALANMLCDFGEVYKYFEKHEVVKPKGDA